MVCNLDLLTPQDLSSNKNVLVHLSWNVLPAFKANMLPGIACALLKAR